MHNPTTITLSAAGFSPWVPLNRERNSDFAVGLGVWLSSGASLTYQVDHTFDNVYDRSEDFSIARTTTTGTVALPSHNLSVGDWVAFSGNIPAPFNVEKGFSVASVVDANSFTITVANSGATAVARGSGAYIHTAHVFGHCTLIGKTERADGNYAFPPFATRLRITAHTGGVAGLNIIQAA